MTEDTEKVWLLENAQKRAESLKLEITMDSAGFQVLPTEEFMGKRTASPGRQLTTGIKTLEALNAYLAGIDAIIQREEMIRALISVPDQVIEISPFNPKAGPNNVRSIPPDKAYRVLQTIYDILYWDSDEERFDPDKEWDSAADFLKMVSDQFTALTELRPEPGE